MVRPRKKMSFENFLNWLKKNCKEPRSTKTLGGRTFFKAIISNDGRSLTIEFGSKDYSGNVSENELVSIWKRYWHLGDMKHMTSKYTDTDWSETPNRILAPYVPALIRDFEFENDIKSSSQEIINTTTPSRDKLYDEFYDPSEDFLCEPRAFCYDLATQLINDAKSAAGKDWYDDINTVKGVLLLLYTWNFAAKKTKKLNFQNVSELIRNSKDDLIFLEKYSISTADTPAWSVIKSVFDQFRNVFGQTGASKALSLLNPCLFVMWDTAIRKRLKKELIPGIMNGERGEHYVIFLKGIHKIIGEYRIAEKLPQNSIVAKKIDEYHYVKIVMDKERKARNEKDDGKSKPTQIYLPDNLKGRSIYVNVIPTVCNLKNMLMKLKGFNGNFSELKPWEKRSYNAYQIDKVKIEILNSSKEKWKEIIRDHILLGDPSDFGPNCVDIYLVAYVAETFGAGKKRFFQFIKEKDISQKENTAQAIWQVGKGDGVFLDILYDDGTIKDVDFFKKWIN